MGVEDQHRSETPSNLTFLMLSLHTPRLLQQSLGACGSLRENLYPLVFDISTPLFGFE